MAAPRRDLEKLFAELGLRKYGQKRNQGGEYEIYASGN
jgi:hypothetical protein